MGWCESERDGNGAEAGGGQVGCDPVAVSLMLNDKSPMLCFDKKKKSPYAMCVCIYVSILWK